jgi:phage tail-like protein
MANDGTAQGTPWPMPKFRFSVDWGTIKTDIAFQEVSGLEAETQIIEYRDSNSKIFSTVKQPGIAKYGNVTMKRGIFANDALFWTWYSQITMNTIKRQTVVVKLLDQTGGTVVTWTLNNAWPTKVSSTDLKSDGNEVAIDSIEIAHEGLTIKYGS